MIGTQPGVAAGVMQPAAALQQTHGATLDTVVVESPLPGGVAEVVRFLLNTVPSWVQMGGVVVGAAVALIVLRFLYRRRVEIRAWLVSRTPAVRFALAAAGVALLIGTGIMGAATWNYTQHSNDFCIGCHVMNPAFQKFANLENKHAELSCHACHQQPLTASMRQLYLWVAERPQEIGEHAKVPDRVCASCHVTGDTATWQRIAATAGHRVHLESDSSALAELQCVSCHGVEVHRFQPVAATCGQSGCHEPEETGIVLGKMAGQTVRHCTSCHGFTADVPALATRDSARGTLVPGRAECLGCHEMRQVLADFNEDRDPHGGTCGMCHNPHVQKSTAEAAATCATSGCHSNWQDEAFHRGASHRNVGRQCVLCHAPHAAKVDASSCEACHLTVRSRSRLRPPLPFDTSSALRRPTPPSAAPPPAPAPHALSPPPRHSVISGSARGGGPSPPPSDADDDARFGHARGVGGGEESARAGPYLPAAPAALADTFPHARHTRLACLVCHQTGDGHGRLTFEPPRGCAICHHQAPTPARCATCHRTAEYVPPQPAVITVTVPGRSPATRPIDFLHARHETRSCMECHTTPVTLVPPRTLCQDCHSEHHAVGRTCSACHAIADPRVAHTTLEVAHQRCDACHTPATIAGLTPVRAFCGTCHTAKATNHYDRQECSVCHFLTDPDAYRAKLTMPIPR
ncbi:MAG: hypothetical protein WD801_00405 [Gemmatimonadaceae bacterium]